MNSSLSSAGNIRELLGASSSPVDPAAVSELARAGEWAELNDRFYKTLAFGTGGLRGRTIGKIVTKAERGDAGDSERPQFPCVGTNAMNFFNVSRATQGLVAYLHEWRTQEKIAGETQDRDCSRFAAFLERVYRAGGEGCRGKWL